MGTKSSIGYIEYPRQGGSLHIYFEMMDCKHYIQDEEGGTTELPKDIATDFAKLLETKYKHLVPKNPLVEELKKIQEKVGGKQNGKKSNSSK